jgi:hypothetical protein
MQLKSVLRIIIKLVIGQIKEYTMSKTLPPPPEENGMNQNYKVSEECFQENIRLFGNKQTEPEQYNLYNGLLVMSATLVSLAQVVENIERQCNSIAQQLQQINRRMDELSRSR